MPPMDSRLAGRLLQQSPTGWAIDTPAIFVGNHAAESMPGDLGVLDSVGLGEGQPIWNRMVTIINARRIDFCGLMGGFDKRKHNFFDMPTFRRALSNTFGKQWIELAMTSAEFAEICEPYLTRKPNHRGEATSMILWHQFAEDMQKLADEGRPTRSFLDRLEEIERRENMSKWLMNEYQVTEPELRLAFAYFKDRVLMMSKRGLTDGFRRMDADHKGSLSSAELRDFFFSGGADVPAYINDRTINVLVDWSDLSGDDVIDYNELSSVILCDDILAFAALVPDKKAVSKKKMAAERPIGSRGAKAEDVQMAQKTIVERCLLNCKTQADVFSALDADGSNTLTREEVLVFLKKFHLVDYMPAGKKAKRVKGDLSLPLIETVLDLLDKITVEAGKQAKPGDVHIDAFRRLFDTHSRSGELIDILDTAGYPNPYPTDDAITFQEYSDYSGAAIGTKSAP